MVEIKSVRGSSITIDDVWDKPLFTKIDGKVVESFCMDASGLLVHRDGESGEAKSLIPFAVDAWAVDGLFIRSLEKEIGRILSSPLSPAALRSLYDGGLGRFPHLYAAPGALYAERSLLRSAIEAYQDSSGETRREIETELSEFGLYPFSATSNLGPEYFESTSRNLTKRKVVEPGWVNQDSVFCKAKCL